MSAEVLQRVVEYVAQAVRRIEIRRVVFVLHGGEPTLAKASAVRAFCRAARSGLAGRADVSFAVQTNAVRIRHEWIELIRDESMSIGISVDGDRRSNDLHRVDHQGRGSYDRIKASIATLKEELPNWREQLGGIVVLDEHFAGLPAYSAMVDDLGFPRVKFLFPDACHDDQSIDTTQLTLRLIEVFDHWLVHDQRSVRINLFTNAIRRMLCAPLRPERVQSEFTLGVAILSDGTVQIADEFMSLQQWFSRQKSLSIFDSTFFDWLSQPQVSEICRASMVIPNPCRDCKFALSCAGGEVPSRYSDGRGFDNASLYCSSLYALHAHIAQRVLEGQEMLGRIESRS
jgi:uncharacterized protein